MYKKMKLLNEKYEINNCNGEYSVNNIKIIKGKIPIIFSAPHAVNQIRDGELKNADLYTGGIVEFICERYNAFGIIRTCNLNDDPNYMTDEISMKYKKTLIKLIEEEKIILLIDIHGCSDKHNYDIIIGTNDGLNLNKKDLHLIDKIKSIYSDPFNLTIDNIFKASGSNTVSNFVHAKTGISCIQFEINNKIRSGKEEFEQFVKCTDELIKYLLNYIDY